MYTLLLIIVAAALVAPEALRPARHRQAHGIDLMPWMK